MAGKIIELTKNNFATDIKTGLVLVDFWAPWCAPCKALLPALEAIAAEQAGLLVVAKVNVDDEQELAARHNVRGIPTLVLFKDGAVVDISVGQVGKSVIEAMILKNRQSHNVV